MNSQALAAHDQDETPIARVLESIADEIARVRADGSEVEWALCALAAERQLPDTTVQVFQRLDLVLQTLGVLKDYMVALAGDGKGLGSTSIGAALDYVTLADVRARLAGEGDPASEDGEWEVF